MTDKDDKPTDRFRLFIKMAGGQSKVAKNTGLSLPTVSNLSRPKFDPSFKVTIAILKAYPALNPKWWFFGTEPMWIDKPINMDKDLIELSEVNEISYSYQKKHDYSNLDKEELISILHEKDRLLDRLTDKENSTNLLLGKQLDVLKNILHVIDIQRETSEDTKIKEK